MNFLANGLVEHILPQPQNLFPAESVYDIGSGIRPCPWFGPEKMVCIEPSERYAVMLKAAGYPVIVKTAQDWLDYDTPKVDVITLLDVIEHMEKEEGLDVIERAKLVAKEQIVVFTPWGFMEQTEDNWGMGEHVLQTHKSGWKPEDLPGFNCYRFHRGFVALLSI